MGFTSLMQIIPPHAFIPLLHGVCLDKIYQLQSPGKINLASHSETRPQVQSWLRQPFSDTSGLLSTGEFRCLSSEQIIMYSWEIEIEKPRGQRNAPNCVCIP